MTRDDSPSPLPVLLGLLSSGPAHAYALHEEFSRELGKVWAIGRSQFYAHLERLRDLGYATSTEVENGARPKRKPYAITREGKKALARWMSGCAASIRDLRLEFLARLYLARERSLAAPEEVARRQLEIAERRVAELRKERSGERGEYLRMVCDFKLSEAEAAAAWIARCARAAGKTPAKAPKGGAR